MVCVWLVFTWLLMNASPLSAAAQTLDSLSETPVYLKQALRHVYTGDGAVIALTAILEDRHHFTRPQKEETAEVLVRLITTGALTYQNKTLKSVGICDPQQDKNAHAGPYHKTLYMRGLIDATIIHPDIWGVLADILQNAQGYLRDIAQCAQNVCNMVFGDDPDDQFKDYLTQEFDPALSNHATHFKAFLHYCVQCCNGLDRYNDLNTALATYQMPDIAGEGDTTDHEFDEAITKGDASAIHQTYRRTFLKSLVRALRAHETMIRRPEGEPEDKEKSLNDYLSTRLKAGFISRTSTGFGWGMARQRPNETHRTQTLTGLSAVISRQVRQIERRHHKDISILDSPLSPILPKVLRQIIWHYATPRFQSEGFQEITLQTAYYANSWIEQQPLSASPLDAFTEQSPLVMCRGNFYGLGPNGTIQVFHDNRVCTNVIPLPASAAAADSEAMTAVEGAESLVLGPQDRLFVPSKQVVFVYDVAEARWESPIHLPGVHWWGCATPRYIPVGNALITFLSQSERNERFHKPSVIVVDLVSRQVSVRWPLPAPASRLHFNQSPFLIPVPNGYCLGLTPNGKKLSFYYLPYF